MIPSYPYYGFPSYINYLQSTNSKYIKSYQSNNFSQKSSNNSQSQNSNNINTQYSNPQFSQIRNFQCNNIPSFQQSRKFCNKTEVSQPMFSTVIPQNVNNQNSTAPLFTILGLNLFFDDILILCLIFFLFNEKTNDYILIMILFLILMS